MNVFNVLGQTLRDSNGDKVMIDECVIKYETDIYSGDVHEFVRVSLGYTVESIAPSGRKLVKESSASRLFAKNRVKGTEFLDESIINEVLGSITGRGL